MATWDDVRRIALALPEAQEGAMKSGTATWQVKGKTFAWERPLRGTDRKALGDAAPDGPVLGVRVEHLIAKESLLQDGPAACFTTPHFDGYAAVLVELDRIAPEELAELLEEAWLARAPETLARAYVDGAR
jgi:hypothetical protein